MWVIDAGKTGEVFLGENPPAATDAKEAAQAEAATLRNSYSRQSKSEPLVSGVQAFVLSFNGEKYLYQQGENWFIAPTAAAAKPGEGKLNLEGHGSVGGPARRMEADLR